MKAEATLKYYGLLTFLMRDIFGYLFSGVIVLVAAAFLFDFGGPTWLPVGSEAVRNFYAILAGLALSYALGIVLFEVGFLVVNWRSSSRLDRVYKEEYDRLCELEAIRRWGFGDLGTPEVVEDSPSFFFEKIQRGLILRRDPTLYFVAVERPNVIRLMLESLFGAILGIGLLGGLRCFFDVDLSFCWPPCGLKLGLTILILALLLIAPFIHWVTEARKRLVRGTITASVVMGLGFPSGEAG